MQFPQVEKLKGILSFSEANSEGIHELINLITKSDLSDEVLIQQQWDLESCIRVSNYIISIIHIKMALKHPIESKCSADGLFIKLNNTKKDSGRLFRKFVSQCEKEKVSPAKLMKYMGEDNLEYTLRTWITAYCMFKLQS